MAKPRIEFTSRSGVERTLQSDYPESVGCRLRSWHPDTQPVGDAAHVLSNERLHRFRTSWRFGCHFEIPGLRMGGFPGSSLDVADELKAQLLDGAVVSLYTEDVGGNSYLTCGLMPGTTPEIALVNRRVMEYTMRFSLIDLADDASEMLCHYLTSELQVYLIDSGSGYYEFAYGNEAADADAFLKDDGAGAYDLDSSRVEKDREFYLADQASSLVVT